MLITRPLTVDERAAQRWTSFELAYDTRNLVHYFRLLPDGRFLFGGRGGTDLSAGGLERAGQTLRAHFERMFPVFAHAETERSWSGLVCLSLRLVPYIGPIGRMGGGYAALAYHGNGVALAALPGASSLTSWQVSRGQNGGSRGSLPGRCGAFPAGAPAHLSQGRLFGLQLAGRATVTTRRAAHAG